MLSREYCMSMLSNNPQPIYHEWTCNTKQLIMIVIVHVSLLDDNGISVRITIALLQSTNNQLISTIGLHHCPIQTASTTRWLVVDLSVLECMDMCNNITVTTFKDTIMAFHMLQHSSQERSLYATRCLPAPIMSVKIVALSQLWNTHV